jgi:hypothetical protein
MTNDIPADLATQGSLPKAWNPRTKSAARTKTDAATDKANKPIQTKTTTKYTPK